VLLLAGSTTTQFVLAVAHDGQQAERLYHELPKGQLARVHELLAVHQTHRFPRVRAGVDYVGVFLAAGVSWFTLPGLGEAALVAAGISAAHGHLDLTSVVAVAFLGASLGGMAGWLVGARGGRRLVTAPGVMHGLRLGVVARGDRFYARYGPIAVLFTPSWIAGIHNMRWSRFLIANTLSALIWAVAIGVGADLIGPSITDLVGDAGLAGGIALAVALVVFVALVVWRSSLGRKSA